MKTKLIEGKGRIVIETALGDIVVQPATDPAYPGVYIDLIKKGDECATSICLAEATPGDDGEVESIRLLVWDGEEDYSKEFVYATKNNTKQ